MTVLHVPYSLKSGVEPPVRGLCGILKSCSYACCPLVLLAGHFWCLRTRWCLRFRFRAKMEQPQRFWGFYLKGTASTVLYVPNSLNRGCWRGFEVLPHRLALCIPFGCTARVTCRERERERGSESEGERSHAHANLPPHIPPDIRGLTPYRGTSLIRKTYPVQGYLAHKKDLPRTGVPRS